ncbi:hypothetical protein SADUNF_Sadunf10G0069400 [Salix dunnii]|uniref:Uncharacterized protein n=1 Tax=Salix dunnii TaxID=1413687 RepID=A0A835JRF8_9ROSI|nr:hypothetical protein SADUNF_Sadunf10G0069400 [Salix dunnii]
MKKWLEKKPRDRLLEEIEQNRLSQAACIKNLKNPNPAPPNRIDYQTKKDVTLYCTLLMPNATFIKKQIERKTDMDDPFFEETVSDISESDDLDEELEDITENVESLGT